MSAEVPANVPTCAAVLELLQRRFDGEAIILPVDVAAHVAGCVDCRERLAVANALTAYIPHDPAVPTQFTDRLVAGVISDVRRRRLMRHLTVAVAAAVAGVGVWLSLPTPSPAPVPHPVEVVHEPDVTAPNLRREFTEAGEAVASLTRRTATDAFEASSQFLPSVPTVPWPDLEPAARPFEDAGQVLAEGFEPVTSSARRAARLFWRELPLASEQDPR